MKYKKKMHARQGFVTMPGNNPAAETRFMLEIGSFRAQLCQGLSRRSFLQAGLLTPLALGLNGATPTNAYGQVRARSVILLWLWGAPSHLDTFDPKPNAPEEYRGPFTTIPTRTSGVRF